MMGCVVEEGHLNLKCSTCIGVIYISVTAFFENADFYQNRLTDSKNRSSIHSLLMLPERARRVKSEETSVIIVLEKERL